MMSWVFTEERSSTFKNTSTGRNARMIHSLIQLVLRVTGQSRPTVSHQDRVLQATRFFADPEMDDELMALRASMRGQRTSVPAVLRNELDRFENRLDRDEGRKEHLRRVELRMLELDSGDAAAHFERLSGHSLDDFPVDHSFDSAKRRKRTRKRSAPLRSAAAREHSRSMVTALVVLFCVLVVGSYQSDSLSGVAAKTAESESILFGNLGETSRGYMDPEVERRRVEIREALRWIDASRTTVLGFHTGYDPTKLARAEELIGKAIREWTPVEPVPPILRQLQADIHTVLNPRLSRDDTRLLVMSPAEFLGEIDF